MKTAAISARPATFETSSRKLEQFLFMHDIQHQSFYKDADNMTVWVYPDNAEVHEVVGEFRRIVSKRKQRMDLAARVRM